MQPRLREPYRERPIRFIELWREGPWRVKVSGIAYGSERPRPELVEAAKAAAAAHLRGLRTSQETYGVAFMGVHDGRGECQVFLDIWCNENELLHTYWVSKPDRPAALAAAADPQDHNSVCVWDLALQMFERDAWVRHVLANPAGPDIEAYLAAHADFTA